ncbi:hypothetical protein [Benzoatithermus flavus]|uniref:Uncharacterized protein n=1 Tax=Benzoatithermus flavus TaxID=3108223 RepID=A0ABU8XPL4_9PROT
MLAQRRSIWPALLLIGAVAVLILVATSIDLRRIGSFQDSPPQPAEGTAALERKIEARVCVTRYGICSGPVARVGDPCTCPHVLRGLVPGHIEILGASSTHPASRDWGEEDRTQDLYDWHSVVPP